MTTRIPTTFSYLSAARAYAQGDDDGERQWLLPLAEAGDAAAQCRLALLATATRDYAAAQAWFERAAAQGHSEAQFFLGLIYIDGQGVPRDYVQARGWFERAAAQGEARAQSYLGWLYDNGYGVAS